MTSRKLGFKTTYLIFSAVLAVVLILITALALKFSLRFDMTKDRAFTISDSTKKIFSQLKDKVKITFYTSEKLPTELESLRRDTLDKFKEFEVISGGNFQYEIIEPLKKIHEEELKKKNEPKKEKEEEQDMFNPYGLEESETRRELMQKGIRELQGQRLERDKLEVVNFFSSIEIGYLDKPAEIIPVYESAENLEYELASRILRLTSTTLPKVAFFDGNPKETEQPRDPRMPPQSRYAPLIDAFSETVQVEEIKLTEASPIPADARCLVVVQPKNLNDRQKYEINKYLSEGGNVILFTSRGTVDIGGQNFMMENLTSGLEDMLSSWGIVLGEKLIASLDMGQITITQRGRGMQVTQAVPLPFLVRTRNADFESTSPILRGVPYVILPWSNPINADEEKIKALGLKYTSLIRTGKEVWLKPPFPFLNDAVLKMPTDKSEFAERQTVGVLMQGQFPFAYEGKEVPAYAVTVPTGNENRQPGEMPMIMPPGQPPEETAEKKEGETKNTDEPTVKDEPAVKEIETKTAETEVKESATETKADETSTTETKEEPAETAEQPKEELKQPEKQIAPKITPKAGNLLIVSSSDVVNVEYVQMRPYQPNLFFFRNAIEIFSLGEELINIRAKTVAERSLIDTTDGQRTRYKLLNMVVVPLLLITFGTGRYVFRRRQAVKAQKA